MVSDTELRKFPWHFPSLILTERTLWSGGAGSSGNIVTSNYWKIGCFSCHIGSELTSCHSLVCVKTPTYVPIETGVETCWPSVTGLLLFPFLLLAHEPMMPRLLPGVSTVSFSVLCSLGWVTLAECIHFPLLLKQITTNLVALNNAVFSFLFFGHVVCGSFVSQPGVEPVLPCIAGKSLNNTNLWSYNSGGKSKMDFSGLKSR